MELQQRAVEYNALFKKYDHMRWVLEPQVVSPWDACMETEEWLLLKGKLDITALCALSWLSRVRIASSSPLPHSSKAYHKLLRLVLRQLQSMFVISSRFAGVLFMESSWSLAALAKPLVFHWNFWNTLLMCMNNGIYMPLGLRHNFILESLWGHECPLWTKNRNQTLYHYRI